MSDYLGTEAPERDDTDIEGAREAFDKSVKSHPQELFEAIDQLSNVQDEAFDYFLVGVVLLGVFASAGSVVGSLVGLTTCVGACGVSYGIKIADRRLRPFFKK